MKDDFTSKIKNKRKIQIKFKTANCISTQKESTGEILIFPALGRSQREFFYN